MKFYPRDWRGDQALRLVSLPARGLWIDMLCVMYEATPYGHLIIGDQPVSDADLARLAGSDAEQIQALLVELLGARVARRTRGGVIYSKRMIADDTKAKAGRKAKLDAIEEAKKNNAPSRSPSSPPSTQRPEARGRIEAHQGASIPTEAKNNFIGPKEVRDAFRAKLGEDWCGAYIDRCGWQENPDRALIPATRTAATKLIREGRAVLSALGLTVLEQRVA
jgi:hypothetical protein